MGAGAHRGGRRGAAGRGVAGARGRGTVLGRGGRARGRGVLVAAVEDAAGPRPLSREVDRAVVDWLFSRSPVAVTMYDTDLRCIRQNAAMTRLTGISEADRKGKRLPEVLSG